MFKIKLSLSPKQKKMIEKEIETQLVNARKIALSLARQALEVSLDYVKRWEEIYVVGPTPLKEATQYARRHRKAPLQTPVEVARSKAPKVMETPPKVLQKTTPPSEKNKKPFTRQVTKAISKTHHRTGRHH